MNNQQQPNNGLPRNPQKGPNGNTPKFSFTWLYAILIFGLLFMIFTRNETSEGSQMFYSQFKECVDSGYVKNVVIDNKDLRLAFELTQEGEKKYNGKLMAPDTRRVYHVEIGSLEKVEEFLAESKENGRFNGIIKYEHNDNMFLNILWQVFPFVLIIFLWMFIMRRMSGGGMGGGIFSVGKSKAKLFDKNSSDKTNVTFKDVAGLEGAKLEVQEIVDFLMKPDKYTNLGGKIPKGALLVGPPGTGKTLLAKAVAGEADVPFFSLSGSDFVEMFVGVGASRVRDLFQQAKAKAPCIIFIDEIDAIGCARSKTLSMSSNDERENTLNQLLTEMDGFGTNSGIIILAATNRADILDKALLRAGRFDRQIHVDLPDLQERKAIFNVHLRPVKIDETVDVDLLARQTPGFSGADIANVCNEAALIAARRNSEWVDRQCFLDAVDRIIGGLEKKTKVMTVAEKRSIALHEAGHATISWFLEYGNPLVKVTIVPRGQALGAAWYTPEERPINTREEMLDQICSLLGGRAAEELCVGRISTGAMNDLERVTQMAYAMVVYYGMGQSMPNFCYYNNQSEYSFQKPYSEKTAELIDKEVKAIIDEQYERAKRVILEHKEGHAAVAQMLVDREVILADDVEQIFGPRPFVSRSEEIIALNEEAKKQREAERAEEAKKAEQEGGEKTVTAEEENEAIVRQKAIDAVVEKAKREEEKK